MPSGRIRCYQRFSTFNFIRFKLLQTVSSRDQTTVAPQKGGGMNNKLKAKVGWRGQSESEPMCLLQFI